MAESTDLLVPRADGHRWRAAPRFAEDARYDSARGAAPRGGRVPRAHGCLGASRTSVRDAAFRGGRGAGSHVHFFSFGRLDWGQYQYNVVFLTYTPHSFSPLF